MRQPGEVLIVSLYEQGHQPLAAASALAFLERAGFQPKAVDLAVESRARLLELAGGARLVALSVPMHTALHLGVSAAHALREHAPRAHRCFYGLYAVLNAAHLTTTVADSVLGGEAEDSLCALAAALETDNPLESVPGVGVRGRPPQPVLRRLNFPAPSRAPLAGLERYSRLLVGGESLPAAAIEASRGCLHRCRHCPIPAVYAGRFFVVPRDVVLNDVAALVARGVRHVTFADPDFLNGPRHALGIVREMHARFPALSFDVTTKIEHVLEQRRVFPELARAGCLFVVSAVESLSDAVLGRLDKGHTAADVREALAILRDAGITLRPSLLPFTPWSTLEDYLELLEWVERERLIGCVDPVQFSIRLLVPPGSLLAETPALQPWLGPLDPERFSYPWRHPDPRMDSLQREVSSLVQQAALRSEDAYVTFARIADAAWLAADPARPTRHLPARTAAEPPRLSEPWFC
ncbi:MAG TPA: CUAEP/CCAEP-tail radical SAM protein [Candidatus Polarisedimenticolaceae bacterium]|nr:CUAEP/CCAEP-tail radical SAM protein [Candidatus Polarisedimenticolaceae bacterium]